MIKVNSTINVYEVNGKESAGLESPTISVKSHWNRSASVVLSVDGKELTVLASDLQAAIINATNTGRP